VTVDLERGHVYYTSGASGSVGCAASLDATPKATPSYARRVTINPNSLFRAPRRFDEQTVLENSHGTYSRGLRSTGRQSDACNFEPYLRALTFAIRSWSALQPRTLRPSAAMVKCRHDVGRGHGPRAELRRRNKNRTQHRACSVGRPATCCIH